MKEIKNNRGFTLVEVLIAVGVLSVASLAFLPSFSNASRQRNLQQNGETLRDVFANARSKALTEVGNPGSQEINKYKYSGVKFVGSSPAITYFRSNVASSEVCEDVDELHVPSGWVLDSKKELSNGIVVRIANDKSPICIFFEVGTGKTSKTEGGAGPVNRCL